MALCPCIQTHWHNEEHKLQVMAGLSQALLPYQALLPCSACSMLRPSNQHVQHHQSAEMPQQTCHSTGGSSYRVALCASPQQKAHCCRIQGQQASQLSTAECHACPYEGVRLHTRHACAAQGPTVEQEQMFWCVDYCRHASISFGAHGIAVWRWKTGVHVLGLAGDQLTGVLCASLCGSPSVKACTAAAGMRVGVP